MAARPSRLPPEDQLRDPILCLWKLVQQYGLCKEQPSAIGMITGGIAAPPPRRSCRRLKRKRSTIDPDYIQRGDRFNRIGAK
jgi:hypothetical protein